MNNPNSLDLLLAAVAIAALVAWWRARRHTKALTSTVESKDRVIKDKSERLIIVHDALDAERAAHRSTTNVLDSFVAQSVILSAKLTQAELDRDNATVLVEQLTHDIAVNA